MVAVYPLSKKYTAEGGGEMGVAMEQMLFPERRERGGNRNSLLTVKNVLHTETLAGEFKVVLTGEEPDMLNTLV